MSADPELMANRVIDECSSTNDLARLLAERGCPDGTWVSARRQSAGRGRHGRKWEGIEGNLFLSVVSRIPDSRLWSWVPLTAAVGAAAALRERAPRMDIRIKWPNDLWVGGAKMGGVLCEAAANRNESFIVIGIGLNCLERPGGLDQETTSLSEAAGKAIHADEVRVAVLQGILEGLAELQARGTGLASRRYHQWAVFTPGMRVQWGVSPTRSGRVRGIGSAGELLVWADPGGMERLFAEDVRIRRAF